MLSSNKLNLGCGEDYREGWVNVDIGGKDIYGRKVDVDVIHDLNKFPYPFKNNSFDEIAIIGVIEHIKELSVFAKEINRISRDKCRVHMEAPYFLAYMGARELTTYRFSLNSFQLFNILRQQDIKLTNKYFLISHNIFLRWIGQFVNQNEFTKNFYERFLSNILVPSNVCWDFIVEKK